VNSGENWIFFYTTININYYYSYITICTCMNDGWLIILNKKDSKDSNDNCFKDLVYF